jgi:hypothetical protein
MAKEYQSEKEQLIEFAKKLLIRAKSGLKLDWSVVFAYLSK